MSKGITPIIAVILLLLITISMVGFAFVWFSRIAQQSAEAAENQTGSIIAAQEKKIRIDNAAGTSVSIRNIGTRAVAISELATFENDAARTLSVCSGSIQPGSVATCTLSETCETGNKLKITAPGNTDVRPCT